MDLKDFIRIIIGLLFISMAIVIRLLPLEKKRAYFSWNKNNEYSEEHFKVLSYINIIIGILFIILSLFP